MSADGEVEVTVQAEGVDEAAGEMAPDAAGAGVGGPDADRDDGGRLGGKLITRLVGLLAFLGPILTVIGVISDILKAFVAPLAVVLLRLLQPVLRFMLQLLPAWMSFIDSNEGMFEDLLVGLLPFLVVIPSIVNWLQQVVAEVKRIPDRIKTFVSTLPRKIGTAISNQIPNLRNVEDRAADTITDSPVAERGDGGGIEGPLVAIGGGLFPFIDRITDSQDFDLP